MSKLLKGTHHICLHTSDAEEFDKAFRFYHEVLGMEVVRSCAGFAMLDTGDGTVMEIDSGVPQKGTGIIDHFALRTDDVDACVAACIAAGRPITDGPRDVTIACEKPYPIRIAFTEGVLGERIEFFQEY